MPLAGVRVVAADEFWADRPQVKWPPTVLRQTDANGREVYWGLAAAQDLTNALGKVLGRAVPLYRESEAPADEGPVVYLGPVRAAAAAGLDAKDMMSGEWRIKCDGKRAFILARTGMGVAYGVTDFLDKFAGYRFLTMDGDDPFTVTPAASVPECDFTAKHCFYERHFSVFDRHLPDTNARWTNRYMRRLGLYISPEAEGHVKPSMCFKGLVHTYTDILPPEKYFASHPEYFTMDAKGNRVNGPRTMLCLSNPEVRRLVTDKFLEAIAKDREENPNDPPIIYDFTQTDGIYYICKCPECRKIAAKYGGDANMDFGMVSEGDAGLQLDFVNEMARKIGAKYPDVRIRTFAYVNTSKLPKGIVPEPNVMPWFCDWYMKSDHQLPLAHPFNSWCREQLEKWKAVSPAMEIYDYMLYDNKYPEVSVDAIAADMRDFKKLGIARFYILSPHRAQCFWQLNTYVYSKFFRDPDTDLEKAIDEYCAVYGAGAAKMREAIDFLRKIIAENPPKSPDLWHKRTLPWRTMENMERLREIVREAMSAETRMKPLARMALVFFEDAREVGALGLDRRDRLLAVSLRGGEDLCAARHRVVLGLDPVGLGLIAQGGHRRIRGGDLGEGLLGFAGGQDLVEHDALHLDAAVGLAQQFHELVLDGFAVTRLPRGEEFVDLARRANPDHRLLEHVDEHGARSALAGEAVGVDDFVVIDDPPVDDG